VAVRFGCHRGGIRGLLTLLREFRGALNCDLIGLGFRVSDIPGVLSWADLRDVVKYQPATSALYREMHPDAAPWGLSEHLLAVVADAVIAGNWMSSRDGQKNKNRPKPIPRPGVAPDAKKFGGKAESMDTIRAWLGW
jgi:hypothetical protein